MATHETVDDRLRGLEMKVNSLERQSEAQEVWTDKCGKNIEATTKLIQDLRLEIHGAKVGGKVALGIALTLGSLVGWLISLLLKR